MATRLPPLKRKLLCLCASAGFCFVAARLTAAPGKQLSLRYGAPEPCGSAAALIERVEQRSKAVSLQTGEADHDVAVDISSVNGAGFTASVMITQPDGTITRNLNGAACSELLDAVALVIVITLDPTGRVEETPEEPEPEAEPTAPPAPSEPETEQKPAEWEQDTEPPSIGKPLDLASLVPDTWSFGAAARGHAGPTPNPLLGPELAVVVRWQEPDILSLRLALAASRSWSQTSSEAGGNADFTLDQLMLQLCPLRFGGRVWALRPCLQGAGGRIIAAGSRTLDAREVERPWGSFGVTARIGVRPIQWLELGADAGLGLATVRDSFQFRPAVFHTVPREVFTGSIGVAFRVGD